MINIQPWARNRSLFFVVSAPLDLIRSMMIAVIFHSDLELDPCDVQRNGCS